MDAKVMVVSVIVKNQSAALDFYTGKVGFEKKTDYAPSSSYRYLTVGPKGQDLELSLWQAGSKDLSGWSSRWEPGGGPPVVLRVDDCRKTFMELKSRGVEFEQAQPEEHPWGITATFSDPDGNRFSINQFRRAGQ